MTELKELEQSQATDADQQECKHWIHIVALAIWSKQRGVVLAKHLVLF